jgi:hypothetical protein
MGRTVWKPALDTTSIPTFAVNLGLPFYIVTVMRKLLHAFMECCSHSDFVGEKFFVIYS